MNQTPRALGFHMPAEWEPHEATWLAWPHERNDWPGKFAPIQWVYGDVVRRLSQVEKVRILVCDEMEMQRAQHVLLRSGAYMETVQFFMHPTNRSWCRDFCPIFVRNPKGAVAVTDWNFNGWARYENWQLDNTAPQAIAKALKLRCFENSFVLEGGSIDVNGRGLLLTTEECLLSPIQARNPGCTREQIEKLFAEWLGIIEVIWLKNGIAGDDTHGHVDHMARFVSADTVVVVSEKNRADPNYAPLRDNLKLLRATPLNIVTLPMPQPVWFDGQLLPASYANFYIANKLVLVPTFNDPNDRVALNTMAKLFPDREIIGINSLDLVLGLGALHCMTQQQPASILQQHF